MKVKLVLLLVAAVGSMALVASAQQPSYVITSPNPGSQDADTPRGKSLTSAVVQATPTGPWPKGAYGNFFYSGNHPTIWSLSGEEQQFSHQAEQLAQQLAAAKSDSDRDKIKSQLSEVLEKQFDQRQKRHEEEIKQLEAQIKKLKDLVNKRQENRREIIGARLNQIVKESQGLGW